MENNFFVFLKSQIMLVVMQIFQRNILNKYIESLDAELIAERYQQFADYFNQYKNDCNTLSAQIAATDKEIDRMVYELYGLTEEEIKVMNT